MTTKPLDLAQFEQWMPRGKYPDWSEWAIQRDALIYECKRQREQIAKLREELQAIGEAESSGEAYPSDGWKLAHAKLCGYARAALKATE